MSNDTDHADTHHAYVIEIGDDTAGIVVRDDDNRFRFYASTHAFNALEQQRFSSPRAAQRAARALIEGRRGLRRAA
jgi:hypothetical protein